MKKFRLIHQNSNIEAPEGRFDIGRSIECGLVLDDPSVSRVHATIIFENEKLMLEDRGSRNGCLLNGSKISGTAQLRDGDRISIGHQSIRVMSLNKVSNSEKTLGLNRCTTCENWVASNETSCRQCGQPNETSITARETFKNIKTNAATSDQKLTAQPQMMITEIIRKAASLGQLDEAEKMLNSLIKSTIDKIQSNHPVDDKEILDIGLTIIALAKAAHTPHQISNLFAFHRVHGSLMPRETVEALYKIVSNVGYRACTEMNRYRAMLSEMSGSFTPGQKFVHRRIEGLVSICS